MKIGVNRTTSFQRGGTERVPMERTLSWPVNILGGGRGKKSNNAVIVHKKRSQIEGKVPGDPSNPLERWGTKGSSQRRDREVKKGNVEGGPKQLESVFKNGLTTKYARGKRAPKREK